MSQGWNALPATGVTILKALLLVSDQEWFLSCRTAGVRHTTDGGQTWAWVNSGLNGADCLEIVPTNYGLLLGTGVGVFLWNGSTWTKASTLTAYNGATQCANGEVIVTSSQGGPDKAYVSTNGLTFVACSGAIHTGYGGNGIFQMHDGSLHITSEGNGVFVSTDNGRTWIEDSAPNGTGGWSQTNGSGFSETDDNRLLYFGVSTISRKLGPSSWENVSSGHDYRDTPRSWVLASDGKLYLGTNHISKGAYVTSNHGTTWQVFNETQPGPAVGVKIQGLAIDGQAYLVAACVDGTMYRSTQPITTIVQPPSLPVARITAPTSVQMGQSMGVDGSASSTGAPPLTYAWDFGDGVTASGVVSSHTYTAVANYIVSLTVTDTLGRTSVATQAITVTAPPPDPFAVTIEGNVHFTSGVLSSYDGFVTSGGTDPASDLDAYVRQHYQRIP